MTNFDLSDIPDAPPPPPIDPMVAREDKIANDTRVESELNRFIIAKQYALFEAPDAYYRKQGREAVDNAPQAIQRLNGIRENLLDGLSNDYQIDLGNGLRAQWRPGQRSAWIGKWVSWNCVQKWLSGTA